MIFDDQGRSRLASFSGISGPPRIHYSEKIIGLKSNIPAKFKKTYD